MCIRDRKSGARRAGGGDARRARPAADARERAVREGEGTVTETSEATTAKTDSKKDDAKAEAPAKAGPPTVELHGVVKSFTRGGEEIRVLEGLDLTIAEGSFEALMGPSGSGKTTLLNLIAGLDKPTSGKVIINGSDIGSMSEAQLTKFRSQTIGFIFQQYNLIPVLTAIENVE